MMIFSMENKNVEIQLLDAKERVASLELENMKLKKIHDEGFLWEYEEKI